VLTRPINELDAAEPPKNADLLVICYVSRPDTTVQG